MCCQPSHIRSLPRKQELPLSCLLLGPQCLEWCQDVIGAWSVSVDGWWVPWQRDQPWPDLEEGEEGPGHRSLVPQVGSTLSGTDQTKGLAQGRVGTTDCYFLPRNRGP